MQTRILGSADLIGSQTLEDENMRTTWYPESLLMIFCKAPLAGQVKTRLIPAMTANQAAAVHRELTLMTVRRACKLPLCPVELCCTPDEQHAFFQQCASDFPLTLSVQRGHDLGDRMHNAFVDALSRYRHALLIGCDCPSLTEKDLSLALQALTTGNHAVIAPAEDGGYVLIGLNQPCPELFKAMPWGSDRVLAETRRRITETGLNVAMLAQQWDVDDIADWRRYTALAEPLAGPTC